MLAQQFYNKNQFTIKTENTIYLQSYNSLIAKIDYDARSFTVFEDFNFSKTTLKHLNLFINDYAYKEIIEAIKQRKGSLSDEIEILINKGIITLKDSEDEKF